MCISGHVSFEKIDIFGISETWLKDYSMGQLKCFYDQKKTEFKNIIVRNWDLCNFLFSFMLKISVYDDFEKKIKIVGRN